MTAKALTLAPEFQEIAGFPRRRFPSLGFPSRRRVAVLERRCALLQHELVSLRADTGRNFSVLAGLFAGTPAPVTPEPAGRPLATVTDLFAGRAS
jgi:hypothetical protein